MCCSAAVLRCCSLQWNKEARKLFSKRAFLLLTQETQQTQMTQCVIRLMGFFMGIRYITSIELKGAWQNC